jgi:hypothetical protein
MRQQLPQRHRLRSLRIAQPQIWDVSDDWCVQLNLMLIDELSDAERGE